MNWSRWIRSAMLHFQRRNTFHAWNRTENIGSMCHVKYQCFSICIVIVKIYWYAIKTTTPTIFRFVLLLWKCIDMQLKQQHQPYFRCLLWVYVYLRQYLQAHDKEVETDFRRLISLVILFCVYSIRKHCHGMIEWYTSKVGTRVPGLCEFWKISDVYSLF